MTRNIGWSEGFFAKCVVCPSLRFVRGQSVPPERNVRTQFSRYHIFAKKYIQSGAIIAAFVVQVYVGSNWAAIRQDNSRMAVQVGPTG